MYGHATNFNVGPWDDKAQWPTWRAKNLSYQSDRYFLFHV